MSGGERWQWIKDELQQLKEHSQYRSLQVSTTLEDGWVRQDGRKMLNLASNHYLGLDQQLDAGAFAQFSEYALELQSGVRTGSTASRLIVGNDPLFTQLESDFANFKGTESCLFFSSGYMANIGIISALAGRNDLVFSDRLNHASIVDGIILSRAEHHRYRHRDMDHLESLLKKADPGKKKLIVSDSIFSMDGSVAPLQELVQLRNRYDAILMIDEAHSGGVYGAMGEGLVHQWQLTDQVDVVMGTFSKAYGCYGAYAAGDKLVIDYLINKARSFIYTTALPPIVLLSIRRQWMKVREDNWRREQLHTKSAWFRTSLQSLGFDTGSSECHIVPLLAGDNELAVQFSRYLQQQGVVAVPIRPPTVPAGTARIRFTMMATHRQRDLDWALGVIEKAGRRFGLIPTVMV